MKKILSFLFAVAIASANLLAQGPPSEKAPHKTPEERAEQMTKRLTKELALTPEQEVKAKAIILKREQEREAKMKADKAQHEKTNAELKSILTEEQYKKLEARQKEMRDNRMKKRKIKPHHGSAPAIVPPSAPEGK